MTTTRTIVIGVDGSPASVAALQWAAQQAEITGAATLEAVISWTYPNQYANQMLYAPDFDWADVARTSLNSALTEAGLDGLSPCIRTVTEGHPAQVLVDASADADLLVVGSRGHGGFAGLLLGSVSEYVIAHAKCPVLVIRQPHRTVLTAPDKP